MLTLWQWLFQGCELNIDDVKTTIVLVRWRVKLTGSVCVCVCVCVCGRRIGEHLEANLPNLDTLILTGNNIQELGDVDTLSSVTTLTTLRSQSYIASHSSSHCSNTCFQLIHNIWYIYVKCFSTFKQHLKTQFFLTWSGITRSPSKPLEGTPSKPLEGLTPSKPLEGLTPFAYLLS